MATGKKTKKVSKIPLPKHGSAPLNFTEEHIKMAREGRSKEAFELLLAEKIRKG